MNDMRGTSGLRLATEPQTVVKFNIHVTSELEETQHHIATPIPPPPLSRGVYIIVPV